MYRAKPELVKVIYRSLLPEAASQPRGGSVEIKVEGEDTLILRIRAERPAVLRAIVTSYLRAIEMIASIVQTTEEERND